MKLIIDIDEETYKDIKRGKIYTSFRDVPQESVVAIANGIPLKDEVMLATLLSLVADKDYKPKLEGEKE